MFSYTLQFFVQMTEFQIKEHKKAKNKTSAKNPGLWVGDRDHSESLFDSCLITKAV